MKYILQKTDFMISVFNNQAFSDISLRIYLKLKTNAPTNVKLDSHHYYLVKFSDNFKICTSGAGVVVTRPLPRDGGMAEDHGVPKTGQLPRA